MIRDSFNIVAADSNQPIGVGRPDSVDAYYSFDNLIANNIVVDNSGKGNHGTSVGVIQMTQVGSVAVGLGAIKGNGTEFVNIDDVLDDVRNSGSGFMMGFATPIDATSGGNQMLITSGDTDANEVIQVNITTAGHLALTVKDNEIDQFQLISNNVVFQDGVKTHWAVVHDSTDGNKGINRFYINGKHIPATYSISLRRGAWFRELSGLDNMRILSRNRNNVGETDHFTGTVDENIISNDTPTQQQILRYVLHPENYNLFNTKTKPIPRIY